MIAAPIIVTAVITASTRRAGSDRTKIGNSRARTKVPAATIVAAWMSAEAGVGPSIASGSQSWKGNCADLPATPTSRHRSAAVRVEPDRLGQMAITTGMDVVLTPDARMIRPMTNARSAIRVTRKALVAARRADSSRLLWPMSR